MDFHSSSTRYYNPCFTTKETEAKELSNLTKVTVSGRDTLYPARAPKPVLVVTVFEIIPEFVQ